MNRGEQPVSPDPSRGAGEPVHSITGAVSPHSDDLDARIRRYLISMSIRVVCVVLAIVIHARWGHWSWWIFAAGAVILPYVAVVMANAVGRRRTDGPAPVTPRARHTLPSAAAVADDGIPVTIHPPVHHESSDLPASEPTFGSDGDEDPHTVLIDSRTSSDQSK
ncbi:DUF3099 domain-containing protein [Kineosporia sp. J2-2]|uniref:DUF3099 domain-containing protein n=1 Tax=Kineosporia corallincola TaxID=2835133 RepID=A0ABS5TQL9_9ACTN|nr:DUF3099 domain-containing protein [Kineosporia corallincola]MBT0772408.1 DUF3099 domain-containing protein [Kineosporia corallincola]